MISGKGLLAEIDAVSVAGCYKWDAEEAGVELDNCTSSSGGKENPEVGVTGITFNCHVWFDVGVSSLTGLGVGSLVTDLKGYATQAAASAGLMVACPVAIITRLTMGAEVRGKIDVSFTAKSKGVYTLFTPTA